MRKFFSFEDADKEQRNLVNKLNDLSKGKMPPAKKTILRNVVWFINAR